MQTFYMTDPGKVRSHNEDNVIILNNNNNEFLLAVADGMGGHKAGEVASAIAIDHIHDEFDKLDTFVCKVFIFDSIVVNLLGRVVLIDVINVLKVVDSLAPFASSTASV